MNFDNYLVIPAYFFDGSIANTKTTTSSKMATTKFASNEVVYLPGNITNIGIKY